MDKITVDYIDMPDQDVFFQKYMCTLRPVVIKDLFKGQAIRDVDSLEKALEHWGEVHFPIHEEYLKSYIETDGDVAVRSQSMALRDYFASGTKKMCLEFSTPPELQRYFTIPDVCISRSGESQTFVNQCFLGNAGSCTEIHIDKAGLHNFLFEIFGRKRFLVFPHSASHKLAAFVQYSSWLVQNFTEADRQAFLAFTGGAEVILDAGDCMYVPSLSWHCADYLGPSMAVSLRFRRNENVTMLLNALFPDMYTQGIAYKIADPQSAQTEYAPILHEIAQAANEPIVDGVNHVRRMRELARDIYARLYPAAPRNLYTFDLEKFFPPPLPEFLDAKHPERPKYV